MQPKPGALQEAVIEKDVEQVRAIVRACHNRRQLDDIDGDGRTALMVATVGGDQLNSTKDDHDIARQMMQLIWNRYRQLGCDLRDMLLYEHQGVYEQWNLLQQAAKYSCEENLGLILSFYEYAFPREGLGFLSNPKYLDMNHVAVWAEPIISERIFSKSCDGDDEKKTRCTRSSFGAVSAGVRDKPGLSQKTPGQNSSDKSEDIITDTDNSSLGSKGNERTPSRKRAPDSSTSEKSGETGRKTKKHRPGVEDINTNHQEREEGKKEENSHSKKKKDRSKNPVRGGGNDDARPVQQPSPVASRTMPTTQRNNVTTNSAGRNSSDDDEEETLETFPSSEQLGSCVKTLGNLLEISLKRSGASGGAQQDLLKTIIHLTKHMKDSAHRLSLTTLLSALRDSIRRDFGNHEDQLLLVQAMLAVVGPRDGI